MDGRRDYLIEVIERAGEAFAALVTGRAQLQEHAADEDVEAAFEREFGALHPALAQVDANTAALLLRPPRRIRLYALMLVQLAGRGAPEQMEPRSRRALELLLAADGLEGGPGEPALVAALAGWVDREALAPEARAALVRLGLA